MTQNKRKFQVISNENIASNKLQEKDVKSYQTNPLNTKAHPIKEQLVKFTNNEAGKRFTVEDLLRSC